MFPKKEELMQKLEEFVEAFLLYRDCVNGEDQDAEQIQMALDAYALMNDELAEFVMKSYGEESFDEPNMRIYFNNDDYEQYDDIAYRLYVAVWESKPDWPVFILVHIAELLRNRLLLG